MIKSKHVYLLLLTIIILCVLTTGCPSLKEPTPEDVAKKWSATIRACQVIPVFPITEDIRPGDIFLVEDTIDKEVERYNKDGYLPLDLLIKRLNPTGYDDFYNNSFIFEEKSNFWQTIFSQPKAIAGVNYHELQKVFFPSYSFTVDSKSNLGLAIPILGTKATFGALNIQTATVSVDISNAYSYGLDFVTLNEKMKSFAKEQKELLEKFAPRNGKHLFLRVVGRVYLAEQITVTIKDAKASAAGASADKENTLENKTSKEGASNIEKTTQKNDIYSQIGNLLDVNNNGKITISQIQEGIIGIKAKFSKPLVFGYLAYDVKVLCEGDISEPISTFSRLKSELDIRELNNIVIIQKIYDILKNRTDPKAIQINTKLNALANRLLPEKYPFITYIIKNNSLVKNNPNFNQRDFQALLDYIQNAENTIDETNKYAISKDLTQEQRNNISLAKEALNHAICAISKEKVLFEAIDEVLYSNSK